jgi:hypothetical protein
MGVEERKDAASRIFARLFTLEARARDSGMTVAERAEHARLTAEGIALFRDRATSCR